MKETFAQFYKFTSSEYAEIWKNCIFCFDANVLLNFYRYSDDTRNEFIKVIEEIKERIWLPYQVGYEFHKNRISTIKGQRDAYDSIIKSLNDNYNKISTDLNKYKKHPLLQIKSYESNIKKVIDEVIEIVKNEESKHPNLIIEDKIKEEITNLFTGKVGKRPSLEEIIKNKEKERYKNKIPPGYKDFKSNENENTYGDYLIWQEILEKSRESSKPVILITDDRKEDWWLKFEGKILGPRPELRKEFKDFTQQKFYMYQADQFLKEAKLSLQKEIKESAINEVKAIREIDEKAALIDSINTVNKIKLRNEKILSLLIKINFIEDNIDNIEGLEDAQKEKFIGLVSRFKKIIVDNKEAFIESHSGDEEVISAINEFDRYIAPIIDNMNNKTVS